MDDSLDNAMGLGLTAGSEATDICIPLLQPLDQSERIAFFAKFLAVTLGHMNAAVGHEASRAIVDGLKEVADTRCHGDGE